MVKKITVLLLSIILLFPVGGFAFEIKDLSKYQSVAVKEFSESDSLYKKNTSTKTEISSAKGLVGVLGVGKVFYKTQYVYIGDRHIEIAGETTWYHIEPKSWFGRRKYNLYYRRNEVMEAGRAKDTLVIAKKSPDEIVLLLVGKDSPAEQELQQVLNLRTASKPEEPPAETSDKDWIRIYFTPGKDCENNIIAQIEKAGKIDIAVYAITNRAIVDAILAAKERGAKIRIITDRLQAAGKGSLVRELESAGLPVRTNVKHKIEHNKFAVFDDREIVSGSYNWTGAASDKNSENCLFFKQPKTKAFSERFEYLWDLYGGGQ
jgi:hypothetical protein